MQACLKNDWNFYPIVVVDDSPLQCRLWQRTLQERFGDVQVEYFTDSREALVCAGRDALIYLIDYHMPHVDGDTLVRSLIEDDVDPHKIVMLVDPEIELLTADYGRDLLAVIEKREPQHQEELLLAISRILKQKAKCSPVSLASQELDLELTMPSSLYLDSKVLPFPQT